MKKINIRSIIVSYYKSTELKATSEVLDNIWYKLVWETWFNIDTLVNQADLVSSSNGKASV